MPFFSAFPAFDGIQQQVQYYVFQNFVPAAGDVVSRYLHNFTQQTGKLTTMGIIGLGVTAIILLATIESALNRIFRVRIQRPLAFRVLMFWALLTLSPLLIGISLSLSTYLYALSAWFDVAQFSNSLGSSLVHEVVPNLIMVIALTIFYSAVPNRTVHWQSGVTGGILAGVLFAILKKLFVGGVILIFSSYHVIYGVLAAIPIFLIWMFLVWVVVLLGALLTSALEDWKYSSYVSEHPMTPAERMAAVLHVLHLLKSQHQKGGGLSDDVLERELGVATVFEIMRDLQQSGYCLPVENHKWVLARDLDEANLDELYCVLGFDLTKASYNTPMSAVAISRAEQARSQAMRRPLSEVVG